MFKWKLKSTLVRNGRLAVSQHPLAGPLSTVYYQTDSSDFNKYGVSKVFNTMIIIIIIIIIIKVSIQERCKCIS